MNARQKAKHYKQMYDLCMTRTKIPTVNVCYKRTERLKVVRTFPREIMENPEIAKKIATRDLAFAIAEELEKFVHVTASVDHVTDEYVVEGNIEIVLQETRNDRWWELETCDGCTTPCIMYEKGMRGCRKG